MRILVTGREGSGKSSFIKEIKLYSTAMVIFDYIEVPLHCFYGTYREGDRVVLIDTPALLCSKRAKQSSFTVKIQEDRDRLIKYVTELPKCTIINNELTIEDLRVRVKKFTKYGI